VLSKKASEETAQNTTQMKDAIVDKMKALEKKIDAQETKEGTLIVNGPLPKDFESTFATAVAAATGCEASAVKVVSVQPAEVSLLQVKTAMKAGELVEVTFSAPSAVVDDVLAQAADADSKLVNGAMHEFLVAKEDPTTPAPPSRGVDIDTAMPYGELAPFGREDTAQELTEDSIKESDSMVDQLEKAEVAEEKRSVFRSLTRLRGAAIASFDGIARSQTGNIDEYAETTKWREQHPLHHLADEESDVSKWAFPSNAD